MVRAPSLSTAVDEACRSRLARRVKWIHLMKTLGVAELSTVHGGWMPDLTQAVQAGNAAAPSWLAAGGFLAPGARAAKQALTAKEVAALMDHGKWIAGGVGLVGSVGWLAGAGQNLYQQYKGTAPAPAPAKDQ